jgi:hypothetical protein
MLKAGDDVLHDATLKSKEASSDGAPIIATAI